jgi:hypothetical protein
MQILRQEISLRWKPEMPHDNSHIRIELRLRSLSEEIPYERPAHYPSTYSHERQAIQVHLFRL